MESPYRIIYCLNQFFGGLGGEDKADLPPCIFDGPRGPAILLQQRFPEVKVVKTVVFGDNYIAGKTDVAVAEVLALLRSSIDFHGADAPDLLLAGPAFLAGRYGIGCAAICKAVQQEFGLPVVTAMHPDNPAVAEYRKEVLIGKAGKDVMDMQEGLQRMLILGKKLIQHLPLVPAEDNYILQGRRQNYFAGKSGAERAVEMLLRKIAALPYCTEYVMPTFDRVPPAAPLASLSQARIALVTSGGIVPRGNPDRIESASASRFGAYSIKGITSLNPEDYQSIHGGYDPTYANQDPNRVLPLDVIQELLTEKVFGRLHPYYYATVGNATSVAQAGDFGRNIGQRLLADGVQGVILTST